VPALSIYWGHVAGIDLESINEMKNEVFMAVKMLVVVFWVVL
jgi:hypothetical protein